MFNNAKRDSLILAQQELLIKETVFLKKQTTNILDEFNDLLQIVKLMNKDLDALKESFTKMQNSAKQQDEPGSVA